MDTALAGLGLCYYVFFDVVIENDIDLDFCLALLLQQAESNGFHILPWCYVGVGLGILAFKFVFVVERFFETFKQIQIHP
jgi:hypothetical protein